MEKIALAPLHNILGLVNRLYTEARPSDSASSRRDRQLYERHCFALCRYKVYRSEYWNTTLEGNSCSRLLDHLDDRAFANNSIKFLNALKTLKQVKDNCPCKGRNRGWRASIQAFREAYNDTNLPWSLKSHILSDHYEEYSSCTWEAIWNYSLQLYYSPRIFEYILNILEIPGMCYPKKVLGSSFELISSQLVVYMNHTGNHYELVMEITDKKI